jgi:beta-phosphoglucomutase-like phosphatase (HAD superfamily)
VGAPTAVVFDLDGVLIEAEQVWDAAREDLVRERGGTWDERATTDMMGMSSKEWSRTANPLFRVASLGGYQSG